MTPHFFPAATSGVWPCRRTVNDVATSGAQVKYLSVGMVLEEGFPMDDLRRICAPIAETAAEAGVPDAGDGRHQVVNRGHGDGIYINTAGIGLIPEGRNLSGASCLPRRQSPRQRHAG